MKFIVEENQFKRIIRMITESSINNKLPVLERNSIGKLFPVGIKDNQSESIILKENRIRGLEEIDLNTNWYINHE